MYYNIINNYIYAMITLRQLEYFKSVYELGQISRAADRAAVSQPALTASLSKLEERLGTKLFHRTRAGMIPTEFADLMIDRCRAVLTGVADIEEQAEGYIGVNSGSLRIGVQQGVRQPVLSRFLPSFIGRYPEISYSVVERMSGELVTMLLADEIDLIVAGYRGLEPSEYTRITQIGGLKLSPMVREGHPLAAAKTVSLGQLMAYPMAAPEEVPAHLPIYSSLRQAVHSDRKLPHIACSDYRILLDVVLRSDIFLAGPVSEFGSELADGSLIELNVPAFHMQYLTAVVDRVDQFHSPVARAFIEQLEKFLP